MKMHLTLRGEGPALVLVHGIPGSAATWEPVASVLQIDHRVVIPDLIGFGRSSRSARIEDLQMEAQAEALQAALATAGIERAAVIGHDFGGPVALSLYRRCPELFSALGLVATNAFADTPIPLPIRAVTWPVIGGFAERLLFSGPSLAMMLRQGSTVALDHADHLGDSAQQRAIGTIFAASLRELHERYRDVERTLTEVRVPTLVVWGDADPFFAVDQGRRTADAVPGARLRVYTNCRHFVPQERAVELAADLRALVGSQISAVA